MAELTKLSKQLAEMIGVKVDEKKKAEPAQELTNSHTQRRQQCASNWTHGKSP